MNSDSEVSSSQSSTERTEAPVVQDHPNPDALPILQEISGTWRRVAVENIEEYFKVVYPSQTLPEPLYESIQVSVRDYIVEVSCYNTSGALTNNTCVLVEEKAAGEYQREYIEKNHWITLTDFGEWHDQVIVDGQLRVEHHHGTVFYTEIYERVQDFEKADEHSGTSKQSVESNYTAITIDQEDSRPILSEISGFWKLVAQENFQEFQQKVFGSSDSSEGIDSKKSSLTSSRNSNNPFIKIRARNIYFEICQYNKKGCLRALRHAVMASKDVLPTSEVYVHDYIEDNKWYTVCENPSDWSVKHIHKGQLRIEYHCGEHTFTNVFERTQDISYDELFTCFSLVLTAVVFFLLGVLIFY